MVAVLSHNVICDEGTKYTYVLCDGFESEISEIYIQGIEIVWNNCYYEKKNV